ncbi:MAG: hypothetical protein ABR548_14070 [Actinomycetota bacterium]|nr:YncE family protein [Actinomycetota bacterium]
MPNTGKRTLTRIDASTGRAVATITLPDQPFAVQAVEDTVWVTVFPFGGPPPNKGSLVRINPSTNRIVATIPAGGAPYAIAVEQNNVWVASAATNQLFRIDAGTNKVVAAIPVAEGPEGVAVGVGRVWVASRGAGSLSEIDPSTNKVVSKSIITGGPRSVAFGFGTVWVASVNGAVTRYDPTTLGAIADVLIENPGVSGLVLDDESAWAVSDGVGFLYRIDPKSNTVVQSIDMTRTPHSTDVEGVAVEEGFVWVVNASDKTLLKIGPGAPSPTPL